MLYVLAVVCFVIGCAPKSAPHTPTTEAPALDRDFSWPEAFRNPVSAEFRIGARSTGVRADGGGSYVNRRKSVIALFGDAASLWTWRGSTTADNSPRQDFNGAFPKRRFLEIDLTHPVASSGAVALGVIRDSAASIHVFFKDDSAARRIVSVWEIPIGDPVRDERVEVWVRANGHQYLLQFGSFGMGKYSARGRVHGEGTRAASVQRADSAHWIVRSAPQSVGRLWNVDDVQNPKDEGLYALSFDFEIRASRGSPPSSPTRPNDRWN